MRSTLTKKEREIAEFAFNGVAFSLLGYAMVIALYLRLNISPLHGLVWTTTPLVVLGISLRRCRSAWPELAKATEVTDYLKFRGEVNAQVIADAIVLFGIGALLSYVTCVGGVLFLGLCAVATSAVPWWKIRLIHQGFFVACVTLCLGSLPPLLLLKATIVWINLVFSAWLFFVVAAASALTASWRMMKIQSAASRKEEAPASTLVS